ncbi:MAG: FUSC family protein, partial [Hafnia alvei]|nr:FUSC family protein [Hafnia alvei]
ISSIRRMLVNWPDRPDVLQDVLRDIIKELQNPETNKYRLAKILSRIYPQEPSDYRLRTFYLRLRYFCWLYLQGSRWIRHVENSTPEDSFSPPKVHSIARHTDSMESAYNALRTFVVIIIGCAFWMSTQWDEGAGALTITAITCVLYSTSASPMTSLTTLFKAMVLLSIGCYLAKFGLMIQIDDFWVFCAFLLPVLLTMQLLKLQNPKTAALWGQVIVFMGSFLLVTNPPEYDYGSFVNDNIAKICGVLLAAVAFQILRPSSDKRKSRRIIRALRLDFMDQISRRPQQDESQFESRIYHRISQLNQSKDELSRVWVLRWGVVLLNCSHIVWQLREWQTRSDPLSAVRDVCIHCLKGIMTEKGVQHESLDGTLAELLRISDVLSRHPDQSGRDLAGLVWRLYCSLSQLQQSVVPTVANKA